jgi:hypothetical protein
VARGRALGVPGLEELELLLPAEEADDYLLAHGEDPTCGLSFSVSSFVET